eukprot:213308-Amphidinium_carterae.1
MSWFGLHIACFRLVATRRSLEQTSLRNSPRLLGSAQLWKPCGWFGSGSNQTGWVLMHANL